MKMKFTLVCFLITAVTTAVHAITYQVGPTRTYKVPSAVAGLVADGDIVEIDAGTYSDCATWNKNNLILRGVGGRAHIKDVVCSGKGIWNFNGNNITVEYIEFSGATNPDQNGAGIRGQGGAFTVRHSYFHNNDNGILCNDPVAGTSDVLVEYCEFGNNGFGDGYSHNMYIGNMNSFTLRYSYTHHAKIGHEIKSRANKNYILYNRISDETSGTASRNIDLPNGGLAIIIGNLIEQGPNSGNSNLVAYGLEGFVNPAPQNIYVVNNTFVNNRSAGSSFVNVASGTGILKVVNNIFAGNGTVILGTATTLDSTTNFISTNISAMGFVNASNYDYQLVSSAKVIGKGSNPGSAGTYALTPVSEYVHNSNKRSRPTNGTIDIGAYEFQLSTGVKNAATNDQLKVWISQNQSEATVSIRNSLSEKITATIYNIIGQPLTSFVLEGYSNEQKFDTSDMPTGIYILKTDSESGSCTIKFLINK